MLGEVFERFSWDDEKARSMGNWDHIEKMRALMEEEKGFFFLTLHLGNWESLTRIGCAEGLKLSIITRFLRNPVFDRVWVRSREKFGLELLAESGSGISAIKAVKKGRALGFIADQHTGEPHGIPSVFLGQEAWCPKALAIMSHRLKAPILPIAIVRDMESGKFDIFVKDVLTFPRLDSEDPAFDEKLCSGSSSLNQEGIEYHIRLCNEAIEGWIREHPEQYLWIHKRFKNFVDYSKDPLPWEL